MCIKGFAELSRYLNDISLGDILRIGHWSNWLRGEVMEKEEETIDLSLNTGRGDVSNAGQERDHG